MNHYLQHAHLWTFSLTVNKTALSENQASSLNKRGKKTEVLSRHNVVLFYQRNVMTSEISRAEAEFECLFLMSGKWSLGAEFAWKPWKLITKPSGHWKRQNPCAVHSSPRLKFSRLAIFNTLFFTHVWKTEMMIWLHLVELINCFALENTL